MSDITYMPFAEDERYGPTDDYNIDLYIHDLEKFGHRVKAERDALRAELSELKGKGSFNAVFGHLDMTPDDVGNWIYELRAELERLKAERDKDIAAAVDEVKKEMYNKFVFSELYGGNSGLVEYIFGTWRPTTEDSSADE